MRRTLATAAATGLTALALLAGPGIANAEPATDQNSRLLNDNVVGVSLISVHLDNALDFTNSVIIT